jgi:hypothetical protein
MAAVIRGPLSWDEKRDIERLAELWPDATAGRIAQQINRHPATVAWYMIGRGLIRRSIRYRPPAVSRNGRHRWTAAEDRRLLELRRMQPPTRYRVCGEIITAEFGTPRNAHSCQVRALMLAAYDGGEETASGSAGSQRPDGN